MPVIADLSAARNRVFAPTLRTFYRGAPLPLDGASVSIEVRLYPGTPGPALLSQVGVPFRDAPAATAKDPDRRLLELQPRFSRAALEGLPGLHQPEPGAAQRFAYEIKLTYSDEVQDLLWAGGFVVSAGVDRT